MPEEKVTVETTLAPSGTEEQHATQAETEQPEQEETQTKTYSQEQYEAGVKRRLERERTKLRNEWETERVEAERQAKLSALERTKEEKTALERERDEARAELESERRTITLERELNGKVKNLKASMKLIGDYVDADNKPDLEAFFADNPEQRPDPETSGSRLSGMNGRSITPSPRADFNDLIRRGGRR